MAYQFPNSPSIGATANGYVWDGAAWTIPGGSDVLTLTTPVGARGSSTLQPIPNWLAGAPIIQVPDDVVIQPIHRGCWVHMLNAVGSTIVLPDDWLPGEAFGARQIGTGPCVWQISGGATMQMPFTKAAHTSISEQYEDVIFRVIANVGGHAAVWSVNGGTS